MEINTAETVGLAVRCCNCRNLTGLDMVRRLSDGRAACWRCARCLEEARYDGSKGVMSVDIVG